MIHSYPKKAGQPFLMVGLSSDTKPQNCYDGCTFIESDTGKFFNKVTGSWVERINDSYVEAGGGGSSEWGGIGGDLEDQTDLQFALDSKADADHNHDADYDATGSANSAVAAHAAAGNPHPVYLTQAEGDALYDVVEAAANAIVAHAGAADPHVVYQKESEKGQANGYASLGADGLVPSAQLPAAGGGSDPWTSVVLGSNFSTTSTSNQNVTGLNFTPQASKRYCVEVYLLLRTATATVGPRPGFAWPSGLSDGGAWMQTPNSATAYAMRAWGAINTQNAASTGVPDTTNSHLAIGGAYFIAGASPSGNFQVTLASETNGTSVTVRAGSFLRYREI